MQQSVLEREIGCERSSEAGYTTRIFTTLHEVMSIASEWQACHQQQERPNLQHHPDVLLNDARMAEAFGSRIMAVALYDSRHLVGVAPFLTYQGTWEYRFRGKTLMRFPMRLARLYGDGFLAPDDLEAQEVLLQAVATPSIPYQMIYIQSLLTESLLWRLIQESPVVRKHFWIDTSAGITPRRMIHLSGTFEDYLKKFRGRTCRKLLQSVRKLEEAGDGQLQVERITRRDQVPAFLQQVEQVSERSWQGTRFGRITRATEAEKERLGFFADRGWLRSYLLRYGQKPIAFDLDYQADGVYYSVATAYDPEWASYAPGKVLFYRNLEDLFAENTPEWLDFCHGDTEFKRFWSNHACDSAKTFLIRKSVYTGLARAIRETTRGALNGITAAARFGRDQLGLREKTQQLLHRQRGSP